MEDSDEEVLEIPPSNVPILTPAKEWREKNVREDGVEKFVSKRLNRFRYKYNPDFVNPGPTFGPNKQLASMKDLKGVYTRAVTFVLDNYQGVDKVADADKIPLEFCVLQIVEGGLQMRVSRSKSFNHNIIICEYYIPFTCLISAIIYLKPCIVVFLDIWVSESGLHCLWPKQGPLEDNAWPHEEHYTFPRLLPLTDKSVTQYEEYEIKRFGLQGNIGNVLSTVSTVKTEKLEFENVDETFVHF
jgi:hypothetical protein